MTHSLCARPTIASPTGNPPISPMGRQRIGHPGCETGLYAPLQIASSSLRVQSTRSPAAHERRQKVLVPEVDLFTVPMFVLVGHDVGERVNSVAGAIGEVLAEIVVELGEQDGGLIVAFGLSRQRCFTVDDGEASLAKGRHHVVKK